MVATVQIEARNHTDDLSAGVRLRAGRKIGQVRPQIIEGLCLPLEDYRGEAITYAMYNESQESRPYLRDDQTVRNVLTDGQVVRVVPEIVAGGLR